MRLASRAIPHCRQSRPAIARSTRGHAESAARRVRESRSSRSAAGSFWTPSRERPICRQPRQRDRDSAKKRTDKARERSNPENEDRQTKVLLELAVSIRLWGGYPHRPHQQREHKDRQDVGDPDQCRAAPAWNERINDIDHDVAPAEKGRRHAVEHENQQQSLDRVERAAYWPVEQIAHEHVD